MINIWVGMVAGFASTLILSMMMLGKQAMGFMPQMDMIGMISRLSGQSRTVAWVIHFCVGTFLYGTAFALLVPVLPGIYWGKGAELGAIGWLIAMLTMMPMAGKGLFGMKIGFMAPMMSLVMHLVFGAMLGGFYDWMID